MKAIIVKRLNTAVQKGYSIIEVMLTLVVVGVGLLAIVQLQSSISGQVGDNKAKAEATSIAEARIEEIRNYTNEPKALDVEKFKTEYLIATTDYTNSTEVEGINATFTREERISDKGNVREISVRVSWKERTDSARDVTVTSEIAYVPPASSGQNSINYASSIDFVAPSGIAKPGEGDKLDLNLPDAAFVSNSDGTTEATDGTNKYLLDGDDIVLTLENADCTDVNNCKDDFTRIHGRVYIDESTYSGLPVGEVYVIASNTAYCTRFLNNTTDGTTKYTYDSVNNVYIQDSSNPFTRIQNETLNGEMTQTEGSYEYFDYTCYVGRGWYGSIGVYIAGGNQQNDRICMGDPDLLSDPSNPIVALSPYRMYRGMLHTFDANLDKVYWSIGVPGGRDLGLETLDGATGRYQPTKPMHNFVLSTLDASPNFDAQDCIDRGVLSRADAYGGLFSGVPDDFVCLNPDVDSYNTAVYSIDQICGEDPRVLINNL